MLNIVAAQSVLETQALYAWVNGLGFVRVGITHYPGVGPSPMHMHRRNRVVRLGLGRRVDIIDDINLPT